jgi:hypothetical protein
MSDLGSAGPAGVHSCSSGKKDRTDGRMPSTYGSRKQSTTSKSGTPHGVHQIIDFSVRQKKMIAISFVVIVLLAGLTYLIFRGGSMTYDTGKATIDDLIGSTSERTGFSPGIVIATDSDRTYPLMATPVSSYYKGNESSPRKVMAWLGTSSTLPSMQTRTTPQTISEAIP